MPLVTAAARAGDLCLNHPEARFTSVPEVIFREGRREAWPASATIRFCPAREQGQTAQGAGEDAGASFLQQYAAERRFGVVIE
jgi:hypothetical protein